ncbi:MAG: nitrilase-related carbon-nitrogen hydrolase [Chthoniobacterales bacterium]
MKIAAAQIDCEVGDIAANARKMCAFAERAKSGGADWVVFPELADTGYAMSAIRKAATRWSEGAVPMLQGAAKKHSLGIIAGVAERTDDCIFNSQVVIDRAGEIVARYRKAHLYSPAGEAECFACGSARTSFAADQAKLGLSICYDLRFPELYRALSVVDGANVLVNSSAWPFPRVEHLRVLSTARAIENQSYFVLANRVGKDNGAVFCGSSAIIDPYGVLIAGASADREELIVGEISPEVIRSVREKLPVFEHRRAEIYN